MATKRITYVLIDGENIDATLGTSILGRRPHPDERPRWDRLLRFAEQEWRQDAKGLFFLAANGPELPMSFIQALTALGYQPIPLSGASDEKVVDMAIQKTLDALRTYQADVMLVSHDGDFLPQVEPLLGGSRKVGLIGFKEFRNSGFAPLEAQGMEFFDLEHDTKAFNTPLPRLRIIPIEEFDPLQFL